VDGGLHDVLREMLLHALGDWDYALTVNDGLDFVDNVRVNLLLNHGVQLHDTSHIRSGGLSDVLLDMMHDVVINFAVDNRLDLNDAVVADSLLDNGSQGVGHRWLLDSLALESLSLKGLSLKGLSLDETSAVVKSSLIVPSTVVKSSGAGGVGVVLVVVGELVQESRHD